VPLFYGQKWLFLKEKDGKEMEKFKNVVF